MKLHIVKLKCNVQNEKGEIKSSNTAMLIKNGLNFSQAEVEIVKHFENQPEGLKYFNISNIGIMLIEDVLLTPEEPENPWFKIKVAITDIDSKVSTTSYLIQEELMEKAQKKVKSLFTQVSMEVDLKSSSLIKVHEYIELPEIVEDKEDKFDSEEDGTFNSKQGPIDFDDEDENEEIPVGQSDDAFDDFSGDDEDF